MGKIGNSVELSSLCLVLNLSQPLPQSDGVVVVAVHHIVVTVVDLVIDAGVYGHQLVVAELNHLASPFPRSCALEDHGGSPLLGRMLKDHLVAVQP